MKKIISILLICIVLFMCSAYASAEGGLRNATVSLSFKGETAYCECLVREAGKSITVSMKLYEGSSLIASWSGSGTSIVSMSKTAAVQSGHTYTLKVSGTIGGNAFTASDITRKCP